MRIYSFLLLLVCTLFFAPVRSHAGFLVKHRTQTAAAATVTSPFSALSHLSNDPTGTTHDGDEHHDCNEKRRCERRQGWAGTASMWVAIGGAIYGFCPLIMIVSLVFAAIGLKPGKPKRGRAIAGLIISMFGIFLWAFLLTMSGW